MFPLAKAVWDDDVASYDIMTSYHVIQTAPILDPPPWIS